MADRYTYIPFIGLGFAVASSYSNLRSGIAKSVSVVLLIIFSVSLGISCWNRAKIFKNAGLFWTDMLGHFPTLSYAYANRGQYYYNEKKDVKSALDDYFTGIKVDPTAYHVYKNRGFLYYKEGNYLPALVDLSKTIELKNDFDEAYNNRGSVYFQLGKYDSSIYDYNKAIELNPDYSETYGNRANAYSILKKFDLAVKDYNVFISYFPEHAMAYHWRGIAKSNLGDYDGAMYDFNHSLLLNNGIAAAYLERSKVWLAKNQKTQAYQDAIKARSLGLPVDSLYLMSLR